MRRVTWRLFLGAGLAIALVIISSVATLATLRVIDAIWGPFAPSEDVW